MLKFVYFFGVIWWILCLKLRGGSIFIHYSYNSNLTITTFPARGFVTSLIYYDIARKIDHKEQKEIVEKIFEFASL